MTADGCSHTTVSLGSLDSAVSGTTVALAAGQNFRAPSAETRAVHLFDVVVGRCKTATTDGVPTAVALAGDTTSSQWKNRSRTTAKTCGAVRTDCMLGNRRRERGGHDDRLIAEK